MNREETNMLSGLSRDEFKFFRKRVVGLILATDMARHVADLSALNALISDYSISDGNNMEMLFVDKNESETFKTQQFLMECSLHSCDISQ